MHGYSSGSLLLVNAEVDSMGGVVEGVGVGNRTSPRRAAIEKVQAELRQEYDVLEERRRELEFLEKGGNPLDFKLGSSASLSVQSISQTDQHPDQFVTSEAKGSFAITTSPHGDSVESSDRPGAAAQCEPNSADNLMLFGGENEFPEVDRNSAHPSRSSFALSEQSSLLDENQNAKELKDSAEELKDSAAFVHPRKAYKRRSRPNRDGPRAVLGDTVVAHGGNGSSFSRLAPREVKALASDGEIQKDHNVSANCNSSSTSPNRSTDCKTLPSANKLELDGPNATGSTVDLAKGQLVVERDSHASGNSLDDRHNQSVFCGQKNAAEIVSEGDESLHERQDIDSTGLECQPCVATENVEDQACASQMNGFSGSKGNGETLCDDGRNSNAAVGIKVLDSESSCARTTSGLNANNDNEMCTDLRNADSNGSVKKQASMPEETLIKGDMSELVEEKKQSQLDDDPVLGNECATAHRSLHENGFATEPDEELKSNTLGMQHVVKEEREVTTSEADGAAGTETEKKDDVSLKDDSTTESGTAPAFSHQGCVEPSVPDIPEATPIPEVSNAKPTPEVPTPIPEIADATPIPEVKPSPRESASATKEQGNNVKVASKADEDSILEEARIIEANRKRISELSVATLQPEYRRKSHWDFVLEEMTWLANDFAQERLWKITAAAQISHQVVSTSRVRFHEQHSQWEQKKVAHELSKAIMEFWHSVEENTATEEKCPRKDSVASIRDYATRYLKCDSSKVLPTPAEAPVTPERISDSAIMDMSWEDHWTEENLFYAVPRGAMEAYRKLLESHGVQCEKTGSSIQEEAETSACDAVTDFGSHDNVYEEEGETSAYDCEFSKSSRFAQKKRKKSTKGYGVRTYEVGSDMMYTQCLENKLGPQQSVLIGKRPASSLNVSIPTKRVRTASRQRVPSPFTPGTSGFVPLPSKTDASSGDTNLFQDDQSTLHGGSHMPNSLEVESVGDFEKQLQFDSTEVSKPKKKKKPKQLISAYEQRWQVDSPFQNEQREETKKRAENHQLESNGSSGLFGQAAAKKPKIMRPTVDSTFDNVAPAAGSVPSPVASQMSNMSNSNKLIKILGGGRDRGRKPKASKVLAGQQGSGSPWSLFEDQALVVLVHDMGPNWELVSDAINSSLQFKCIYRKPVDCKEHHKILMDKSSSDGADSAEDSGSSQPYPSTLPGIPKGSARQLFQRLQGPMEEDTLKSHFEKIITISQKLHYRKAQKNDNHDPKQLQQPHSSHMLSLSQVLPNNLNGRTVLTPLDLCDATASSPDIVSLGYQSPQASGLAMSNQGTVAQSLSGSGANPSVQGSTNLALPNNFSSPSALNMPVRDGRYALPRSVSSIDEQRMQQYNQMSAGRNMQQPNLPSPGAITGTDRGVRMLPVGNGMGIVSGVNRNVAMARPGFQPMASSPMLNSGNMLSSCMVAMPSPVNMQSGPGPVQGNSMMRARDALQMMRPNQNHEPQRQILAPDIQMQGSQVNSQGVAPYGGLSPSFPNQAASSPVSSYPLHHHQSHPVSSQQPHMLSAHHSHLQGANHSVNAQQQAYLRLAKERHQLQQRYIQQQQQQHQQQQFAASGNLMPHVQSQQVPMPSPLQNSSQLQPQSSSPPVSFPPLTSSSAATPVPQHQQKHQMPPHGHVRNTQAGGTGQTNQLGKQRRQPQQQQQQQQPQFQQAGRLHPQQRQQSQAQQQTKHVKGAGRGNMVMQQNNSIDPSLLNGLPSNLGTQSNERSEHPTSIMPGQSLHSGSVLNSGQNAKQVMPPNPSNQSQPQQKMYPNHGVLSAKQLQQKPSESDSNSQGHVAPVTSGPNLSSCQQSVLPSSVVASSNHQQSQQHPSSQMPQKLVNQKLSASHAVPQMNRQVNVEQPNKLRARESQIEQHPMSSLSHTSTSMSQVGNDTLNETQGVPPRASQ